ncbi:MAG: hypothetical protein SH850_29965 [Planctomycetaceae bacterium]|nr:hypothetical protein [Planctomycetaceae bacterium]
MAKQRLVPCVIHIPTQYNDGTEVESGKLAHFLDVFDRQFNGCTVMGIVEGHWCGTTEPMQRVEVSIPKDRIALFESIAKEIGRATRQQAIYVVINFQADARIIELFDDEADDQGSSQELGGSA